MNATAIRQLAALAALGAIVAQGAACKADLEEGCVGGACGGSYPGASAGGAGGSGGGGSDAGAPLDGGDAAACTNVEATGDFPPAVAKALVNCQRCHVPAEQKPLQPAPFTLLRYEDVKGIYGHKEIWSRMAAVIREGTMPALPPKLDAADEKALLDWLDACAPPAPEGHGCDVGEGCSPK